MPTSRWTTTLALFLIGGAGLLRAPRVFPQATPGARVRVTLDSSATRIIGIVESSDADSLRLALPDGRVQTLPQTSVSRMELSQGRRSNAGKGALLGAAIGGLTGLVLGVAASTNQDSFYQIGGGEIAAVTAFLGAVGAGVGAVIGSGSSSERWQPLVPNGAGYSPVAGGVGRRFQVGLRIPL